MKNFYRNPLDTYTVCGLQLLTFASANNSSLTASLVLGIFSKVIDLKQVCKSENLTSLIARFWATKSKWSDSEAASQVVFLF